MKRIVYLLLAALLAVTMLPAVLASAAEETEETVYIQPVREPGYCGENITWSIDTKTGILSISGNGTMDDFTEFVPWEAYREDIKIVVISGNVVNVGANAFADYDALEAVNLGEAMTYVGTRAFQSCDNLTSVSLPSGFRRFGEESFLRCEKLTQIYCAGGMPSFNLNCLWDTYARIYYPANNPWPLEHIEQLESAFQGRIEFLADDGTDPYVPQLPDSFQPETVETTPPPQTQETMPETTEAQTEPETEPETKPVQPEETTSEPEETHKIWTTEAPTEPGEKTDRETTTAGPWVGLFIISGTLSLVFLGALIFRRRRDESFRD